MKDSKTQTSIRNSKKFCSHLGTSPHTIANSRVCTYWASGQPGSSMRLRGLRSVTLDLVNYLLWRCGRLCDALCFQKLHLCILIELYGAFRIGPVLLVLLCSYSRGRQVLDAVAEDRQSSRGWQSKKNSMTWCWQWHRVRYLAHEQERAASTDRCASQHATRINKKRHAQTHLICKNCSLEQFTQTATTIRWADQAMD